MSTSGLIWTPHEYSEISSFSWEINHGNDGLTCHTGHDWCRVWCTEAQQIETYRLDGSGVGEKHSYHVLSWVFDSKSDIGWQESFRCDWERGDRRGANSTRTAISLSRRTGATTCLPPPVYHGALTASRQAVDYPPLLIICSHWHAAEPSELWQQLWSVTSRDFDELSRSKGSCEMQEKLAGIRVGNTLMTHIHTDFLSRASLVVGMKRLHLLSQFLMLCHSTHAQHLESPKCQREEEEGHFSFWKCHGINIVVLFLLFYF